jgi:hypothetical protein
MSKNEQINENTERDLEYIGSLIVDGFTSGYYPEWKLSVTGLYHDELSDTTLEHISKCIFLGFVAGEVVEDYRNFINRGRWKLFFNF